MLNAKTLIDRLGLKSAIFVSSPYHMRRVKLIVSTVFKDGDYNLFFVPSRYEKTNGNFWYLYEYDLKNVTSEYLKIAWFLLYEPFS